MPQPDVRRGAVALDGDTVVLAVGGWPGQPYNPLPWEPIYLAQASMRRGDWRAAAQILEREAGEHRQHAFVRFHLARLGQYEPAIEELRAAIEARPELRERRRGQTISSRCADARDLRSAEAAPS